MSLLPLLTVKASSLSFCCYCSWNFFHKATTIFFFLRFLALLFFFVFSLPSFSSGVAPHKNPIMGSRQFCRVNIWTEPPISIQKEGEEIDVGLIFKVVERESWMACSADGASTFVVDQRETSSPSSFFATSIPNPTSLQRFDEFIHSVILHLGIPNEFSYSTRVFLLSHVEGDIRKAKETEFKNLVIDVLIELETQYRLVLGFGVVPTTGFGAVPATETAIASALSRKKFKKEKEGSQETCVICLEEFVEKTQVNQLHCNHIFHKECIMNWLRESGFCPICRFKIQD